MGQVERNYKSNPVIPAQAGIHEPSQVKGVMGSRLRGNDGCGLLPFEILMNQNTEETMNHRVIVLPVTAIAVALLALTASAQTYPAKSVRLILPFAPGSAVDVLARHYAQKM